MNARRLSLVAVVLVAAGCNCGVRIEGSGTSKTEERDVTAPYHRVEVADGLEVKLTDRDPKSLSITTDDNLLEHLTTDVTDGVLRIAAKDGELLAPRSGLAIEVSAFGVNEVGASGAAHVTTGQPLVCDRLAFAASGASKLELDAIVGDELVMWVSGASQVKLRDASTTKADFQVSGASQVDAAGGKLSDLNVGLSGSSQLELSAVAADTAKVDVSGSSQARLRAAKSVAGTVSGASELTVHGAPAERTVDASGGSTVSYEE